MSGTTTRKPASRKPKPQSTTSGIRSARKLKAHAHRPPKPQPAAIATNADYMTRQEVAAFMRVDIQTVDYCIRHRGLRASRFSRRVLIKRGDLEQYLTQHQVKTD